MNPPNRNAQILTRWCSLVMVAGALMACQTPPPKSDAGALTLAELFPGWEERPVLGKRWKPFEPVVIDGQAGLAVQTDASLSLLRRRWSPALAQPADLRFSWWVRELVEGADLSDSQASDAPAQVALAFDGDRSVLSTRFAMMSELTQLVTGDPLPYASLVYVWTSDKQHPVGSVINDPRTDRIRYLVVEQGSSNLRKWVHHTRDVQADYRQVFQEEPGPILGVALMSDADNTRGHTRAVFGPVTLEPR